MSNINKFNNKKIIFLGKTFDSAGELSYYKYLIGIYGIENIELQPKFELIPSVKLSNGKKQLAITYSPDFKIGNKVIEFKGFLTEASRLRIKMFNWKYQEFDFEVISENPDKNSVIKFVTYDEAQKYIRDQKKKKLIKKVKATKPRKKPLK